MTCFNAGYMLQLIPLILVRVHLLEQAGQASIEVNELSKDELLIISHDSRSISFIFLCPYKFPHLHLIRIIGSPSILIIL